MILIPKHSDIVPNQFETTRVLQVLVIGDTNRKGILALKATRKYFKLLKICIFVRSFIG